MYTYTYMHICIYIYIYVFSTLHVNIDKHTYLNTSINVSVRESVFRA